MNQDSMDIDVNLTKEGEEDVLIFNFPQNKLKISLTESNNNDIKEVFKEILRFLLTNKIVFKLIINENYNVELYKEVSQTYIQELNTEITNIRESSEWEKNLK